MGLLRCYKNRKLFSISNGFNGSVKLVLLSLFLCFGVGEASLNLTKECGEIQCQALEYCSFYDHICRPCNEICDSGNHNFNGDRCYSDCQEYIHDERYLKHNSTLLRLDELEEKYKELENDAFVLKVAVGCCVVVIILLVAFCIAFFVYFWKLMHPPEPGTPGEKKKKPAATASVELPTVYNNRYGVTTPTPETSPSSVISSSPADTNMTTLTSSTTIPPYGTQNGGPGMPTAHRQSPTKSEYSAVTPGTATTTLSAASTIVNRGRNGSIPSATNKFRREPSESTLPENCAYDNLSMSPQHCHYSHHV